MNIILAIGALLIVVVLGMLIRITNLVDVMRGTYQKRVGLSNQVNAALFVVFLILGTIGFVWITLHARQYYLPEASSEHGPKLDYMFWQTMAIITFVFIATHILLFVFPFIYQYKDNRKAVFFPDNHKLELIWTVIPAIVLTLLVFGGWKAWSEVTSPAPSGHTKVEIVGKQFNWIVRYPGTDNNYGSYDFRNIDEENQLGLKWDDPNSFDDVMPSEIHLPVGKPVEFSIRARDVLHSVFAIHFRQKMDAVPGMPTSFWFTPTKTTGEMRAETGNPNFNYEIACTEVCGRNHFAMRMLVVVETEAEYQKWLASQPSLLARTPGLLAQVPDNLKSVARQQIKDQPEGVDVNLEGPAAPMDSANGTQQNAAGTGATAPLKKSEASL